MYHHLIVGSENELVEQYTSNEFQRRDLDAPQP